MYTAIAIVCGTFGLLVVIIRAKKEMQTGNAQKALAILLEGILLMLALILLCLATMLDVVGKN